MQTRDLFIVITFVALLAALYPGREPPIKEVASSATLWSVHGVRVEDTTDSLIQRFGEPVKDKAEGNVRFTILDTPGGEIRRTEFLDEGTAGVSGTILEREGVVVVNRGDSPLVVRERLGAPSLIRRPDDVVSYQYDGARVYFRDDEAFGVVIEGALSEELSGD